jgi:hypothetical protein
MKLCSIQRVCSLPSMRKPTRLFFPPLLLSLALFLSERGGAEEGDVTRTLKVGESGFTVVYPYGTGRMEKPLLTFNGGIMSHHLAAELADRIAAIAPVGGPLMRKSISPKRTVPVMPFHGTGDEFAPFESGFGKGALGRAGVREFRSVDYTAQNRGKANGCETTPKIEPLPDKAEDGTKVTRKTWRGGKDGSEVVLIEIEIENGGHNWPGIKPIVEARGVSTMDISANDLMREFFQKHSLKPVPPAKAK